MPTFADLTRPFPVPALLNGAGDVPGFVDQLRRIRARVQAGKTPGIPTGLKTFDEATGGLQAGVHLLAASPGAGKTTLALQVARQCAAAGATVIYCAFDEGGDRLALKLAATAAGLNPTDYLKGRADTDDLVAAVEQHHASLARIRIYNGPAQILPAEIEKMVHEARDIDGADDALLVVDYIQSWASRLDAMGDFRVAVTHLMGQLRQVALQAQVPVLAIAAQNRTGQGEARMASLRESSDLEYGADSISFLVENDTENKDARRRLTLSCLKNRWGGLFDVALVFDAEKGVFAEDRKPW